MLLNSASTSPNNHLLPGISRMGVELQQFNLRLPPELKAEADALATALGLPLCRFAELAMRLYIQHLDSQDGHIFPPNHPHELITRLYNKHLSR